MAQASTATAPPVMDVVAPPAENDKKSDIPTADHTEPAEAQDPLDKLAAQDQREQQTRTEEKVRQTEKPTHHVQTAKPKEASKATGVGLAITATTIIVLGLAALATYAYMQTNA